MEAGSGYQGLSYKYAGPDVVISEQRTERSEGLISRKVSHTDGTVN